MFFPPAAAAYLPLPAFLQAETSPSPAFNSRRVPRSIDGTGRRTSHRRSDYRLTELPVSSCVVPPLAFPLSPAKPSVERFQTGRGEMLRRPGNSIGFGPMGKERFVFVLLVFSCSSCSRFAGDLPPSFLLACSNR